MSLGDGAGLAPVHQHGLVLSAGAAHINEPPSCPRQTGPPAARHASQHTSQDSIAKGSKTVQLAIPTPLSQSPLLAALEVQVVHDYQKFSSNPKYLAYQ